MTYNIEQWRIWDLQFGGQWGIFFIIFSWESQNYVIIALHRTARDLVTFNMPQNKLHWGPQGSYISIGTPLLRCMTPVAPNEVYILRHIKCN